MRAERLATLGLSDLSSEVLHRMHTADEHVPQCFTPCFGIVIPFGVEVCASAGERRNGLQGLSDRGLAPAALPRSPSDPRNSLWP